MTQAVSVAEIWREACDRPNALSAVLARTSLLPIARLLIHPWKTVLVELTEAFADEHKTFDAEMTPTLLRDLVVYALKAEELGVYWGDLALKWLESGFPYDPEIAHALAQVHRDKRFSQTSRHSAMRIARSHGPTVSSHECKESRA